MASIETGATVRWNVGAIVDEVAVITTKNMRRAAQRLEKRVRATINRPNPTGKNPSRPGEPPKRVTGTLFRAIRSQVKNESPRRVRACIGVSKSSPAVKYFRALECGAVLANGAILAPRPFMRRAFRKNRTELLQILSGKGKTPVIKRCGDGRRAR